MRTRGIVLAVAVGLAVAAAVTVPPATASVQANDWPDDCNPANTDIVGTPGDDVLRGTAADESICGMGGDDEIIGGGGSDFLHGNDGNDTLIATAGETAKNHLFGGRGEDRLVGSTFAALESLAGGPDDDILEGNNNNASGTYGVDLMDGQDGDDVLLGGVVSSTEDMTGGAGHDVLFPTPVDLFDATVDAGPGNDVVIALDFEQGGDIIDLDGKDDVSFGIGRCKVNVPLDYEHDGGSNGNVSCGIPWPRQLTGLGETVDVSASLDTDGNLSVSGSLYDGLANISLSNWHEIAEGQVNLSNDMCLCDPLVEIGTTPEFPQFPFDWAS